MSYTFLVPLLDVSSGVFPVTRVDQGLDVPRADYEPFGEFDQRVHDSCEWIPGDKSSLCEDKLIRLVDEGPEKFWNVPVGLQIMGRRLEEEKVVGMLVEIEKAFKAADVHP